MLEITTIRQNPEAVIARLKVKYVENAAEMVAQILQYDAQRRSLQQQRDDLLNRSNILAQEIGQLYKQGKRTEADALKTETLSLKESIKQAEADFASIDEQLNQTLVQLPNLPHELVPEGATPEDNFEIRRGGIIPDLPNEAQPHWDLVQKYRLIDFETGAKITGSGFPLFVGRGAKLQRALINFFLDRATEAGYTEYIPPHVVNQASAYATGQLPDKEAQMYHVTLDDLYLIPTAEVPLTNIYRDVILPESELPIRLTGYTPCFRREAGAAGKDTRGLNRLHQFDKVEIVQIQHPEHSYTALDEMVLHVEQILQSLQLPYRIIRLCGGDMSFASAMTYDFEVYSAAQQKWLEVSSVSNFETFQANRLQLRYRDANKKNRLAHTLNGSALALPRIMAALLENNQTPDGILIPDVLHSYTGFSMIK